MDAVVADDKVTGWQGDKVTEPGLLTVSPPHLVTLSSSDPRHDEITLAVLRRALAEPGDHRLFRSGKLAGLFPNRAGASAEAAREAVTTGLLETVRTEQKGKLVTEWVRVTPKGVAFVHDRDSPKAVIAELKEAVGATRAGVPGWLADARRELAGMSEKFERQADEILSRLDALTDRLDAALRRAEIAVPALSDGLRSVVPWASDALAHLDRRTATGLVGGCPLGVLFQAVQDKHPELTVPDFHAGLRRLHDTRTLTLTGTGGPPGADPDPEYAMILGSELCYFAER